MSSYINLGVNAVLYYSNNILAGVIPNAAYVSLGITVVNALMTFPSIYLIEVRICLFHLVMDIPDALFVPETRPSIPPPSLCVRLCYIAIYLRT